MFLSDEEAFNQAGKDFSDIVPTLKKTKENIRRIKGISEDVLDNIRHLFEKRITNKDSYDSTRRKRVAALRPSI